MNERFKLHRKDAPETSVAAAHAIDLGLWEKVVFDEIREAGDKGITIKELVAKYPHASYSTISARPSGLERRGLIYYQGDKRNNARVIRAVSERRRGRRTNENEN